MKKNMTQTFTETTDAFAPRQTPIVGRTKRLCRAENRRPDPAKHHPAVPPRRRPAYSTLAAAAFLLLCAAPLHAQFIINWLNRDGGEFTLATNWTFGILPHVQCTEAYFGRDMSWGFDEIEDGIHVPNEKEYEITFARPIMHYVNSFDPGRYQLDFNYGSWKFTGDLLYLENSFFNEDERNYLRTTDNTVGLTIENRLYLQSKKHGLFNFGGIIDVKVAHLTLLPLVPLTDAGHSGDSEKGLLPYEPTSLPSATHSVASFRAPFGSTATLEIAVLDSRNKGITRWEENNIFSSFTSAQMQAIFDDLDLPANFVGNGIDIDTANAASRTMEKRNHIQFDTHGWESTGAVRIADLTNYSGKIRSAHGTLILGSKLSDSAPAHALGNSTKPNTFAASGALLFESGLTFPNSIWYSPASVNIRNHIAPKHYTKTVGVDGEGTVTLNGELGMGGAVSNVNAANESLALGSVNNDTAMVTLRLAASNPTSVFKLNGGLRSGATSKALRIVGEGTVLFTAPVAYAFPTIVEEGGTLGGNVSTASPTTLANGAKLEPATITEVLGENEHAPATLTFNSDLDLSASATEGVFIFHLDTPATSSKVVVNRGLRVGYLTPSQFTFNTLAGFGVGAYTLFESPAPIAYENIDDETTVTIDGLTAKLQMGTDNRSIKLIVE